MWSACDPSLPSAACGLVRRVLLALMVCARSALADEPPLATPPFGGVRELAGLRDLLCPPEFLSMDAGRRLEAHATPCADTELQPEAGRVAAAPGTDQASAMATEVGSNPEAPLAYLDAGMDWALGLVPRANWSEPQRSWAQLPALRLLGLMRFHGGGLIITDAGSQYFFKLRGIRSIRLGVRFSF
jgi:hypothetical protein